MIKSVKTLKILNMSGFAFMILLNALANIIPIGGKTTGEISNMYSNLFTPAPLIFSIWGVIYAFALAFVLFTSFSKNEEALKKIDVLFFASSILNGIWIIFWHLDLIFVSLIVMLLLLATLILIYLKIYYKKYNYFLVKLLFSLYLAWISVATIANVAVFLVSINFDGFGIAESIYTIIVCFVAFVLGSYFLVKKRDFVFVAVIIWAFIGIILNHINFYNKDYMEVIISLVILLTLFALEIFSSVYRIVKEKM